MIFHTTQQPFRLIIVPLWTVRAHRLFKLTRCLNSLNQQMELSHSYKHSSGFEFGNVSTKKLSKLQKGWILCCYCATCHISTQRYHGSYFTGKNENRRLLLIDRKQDRTKTSLLLSTHLPPPPPPLPHPPFSSEEGNTRASKGRRPVD